MKHSVLKSGAALLVSVLAAGIPSGAWCEDNSLTDNEKASGWALLFDGKSIHGWNGARSDGTTFKGAEAIDTKTGKTPIEDGCINPHGWGAYMLITDKPYGDCILSLDFKISAGCNSGVFVRTNPLPAKPKWDVGANGIETQIIDTTTAGYTDTGAIYDLVKPIKNAMRPVGDWNHLEITNQRNTIDVVLNGEAVTHADLSKFTQAGKRPDGTDHKFPWTFNNHPRSGYVGLQDHGSPCWFKNIKLKPLKMGPAG